MSTSHTDDTINAIQGKSLSFLETTKDQLLAAALTQKDRIADQIDGLAQSLHGSSEQFAGHQEWVAAAIGRGAAELKATANMVRGSDLPALLAHLRSLARRQPAVVAVGAVVAGAALLRVGKLVAADLQPKAVIGDAHRE